MWNFMKNFKNCEKAKDLRKKNWRRIYMCPELLFLNGNREFPKVKETT